jgi:hypothetical protein
VKFLLIFYSKVIFVYITNKKKTMKTGIKISLGNEPVLSDVVLENVEALASGEINPDCPNGCSGPGGGCHCNGYHPHYDEYSGW